MPVGEPRLPDRVSRDLGGVRAYPTGSGTTALLVALEAVGVRGRRVLIPAITCPNVAIAVLAAGGRPVAVDVSRRDCTIDPTSVAAALDDRTAAIVAVDAFGYPADMAALQRLGREHGVPVIEDACQALGGRADGMPLGVRGSLGTISFGYAKPLTLEGGGLLIAPDPAFHDRIDQLLRRSAFGRLRGARNALALRLMRRGRNRTLAFLARRMALFHYGMPPASARLLPAAWDRFMDERESNMANLKRAAAAVAALPGVRPFAYEGDEWLPWRYSFCLPDQPDGAADLLRRLEAGGIRTTRLYRPVGERVPLEPGPPLPGAEWVAARVVNLAYPTTSRDTRALADRLESLAFHDGVGA